MSISVSANPNTTAIFTKRLNEKREVSKPEILTHTQPATGIPELKQAVCDKLQRDNDLAYDPSQVVVSCGAKHTIFDSSLLGVAEEAVRYHDLDATRAFALLLGFVFFEEIRHCVPHCFDL